MQSSHNGYVLFLPAFVLRAQDCPTVQSQVINVSDVQTTATGIKQGASITLVVVGSTGDDIVTNTSALSDGLSAWTGLPGSTATLGSVQTTVYDGNPSDSSTYGGNPAIPSAAGWVGPDADHPVVKVETGDPEDNGCVQGSPACTKIFIDSNGNTVGALTIIAPDLAGDYDELEDAEHHEDGHVYGFADCEDCSGTVMNNDPDVVHTITSCDDEWVYHETNGAYGTWGCSSACDSSCVNYDPNSCFGDGGDATCGLSQASYDEWEAECGESGGVILDCSCTTSSPIIIDVGHTGYSLTGLQNGVQFAISNTMSKFQVSWTAAGSANAFLVLDHNGNGTIDNGSELFGNFTDQPPSNDRNGFLALAFFDEPENGGNNDGIIDAHDAIFSKLRLWVDNNHDGISQPEELFTLPALGVYSISLDFRESRRTDQYGNQFRYRAKINEHMHSDDGRWAVDVFLVTRSLNSTVEMFRSINRRPPSANAWGLRNDSVEKAIADVFGSARKTQSCLVANAR